MDKTVQELILEIKKKVGRDSLWIGRIPEQAKTEFIEMAKKEFKSDYGMALKWMIDFRKGLLGDPNQQLLGRIECLEQQFEEFQTDLVVSQETKTKRKMVGGNLLGKGEKNEQVK